jgi:serine/threonine protein kinase
MSDSDSSALGSLSTSQAVRLDEACRAFVEACGAGHPIRLEDCLPDVPEPARALSFKQLLKLELAYRIEAEETPTPKEYRDRFPAYAELIEAAFRKLPKPPPAETRPHSDGGNETSAGPAPERTPEPSTVPIPEPPGPPPEPELPKVPGYEIYEKIAEGGMGVVYRGRQVALNRPVALKMIRGPTFAGPQGLARFRVEAQAVARLDHPHVVRIYDFGEWDGLPYFAMEFMAGGPLAASLKRSSPAVAEAARIVEILARAMSHAHERGIVHRDLKPGNVLLTADRIPKIADFGVAKRLDPEDSPTLPHGPLSVTGMLLGTIPYMAPEQAAGKVKEIGPAADIYALGAILYECLTGRPPFLAATPELTLCAVQNDEPTPPSDLRPDVPPELEAVCLKCLEKERGHRYAGAAELADDLMRFLDGEALSIDTGGEWERRERWARKAGFEILDVLTCGVRDVVYKAREVNLDHLVALKVLNRVGPSKPEEVARLRGEAQVLAKLRHPNIVQFYRFGEANGRPYFAMEYVEGGDLIEKYVDRPAPPALAAELIGALARAMDYAHQQGVVHCALKPSNVLLTRDGVPKVTNFGLAVLVERERAEARTARAHRRLASYLAPELAGGGGAEIGPAVDIYALGAILYKLLSGGPPFLADTVEATLEQVLTQDPVPPGQVQSGVPRGLEAICLHCLQKDPARRPGSAGELAELLRRFLTRKETATDEFELIPGYEVLEELGRGGLGIVHKARHVGLDLLVALKVFDRLQPQRLARIRAANQAMARLHHPNILRVYDCGERDGLLYAAEELVVGSSLAGKADGSLPPAEAARLVETLAGAVHHAHKGGIVHRNLKPQVVLLTEDGQPKISSFEMARLLGQDPAPSERERTLVGTPLYMAPEQIAGDVEEVGPTADVYALGAILYQLLTGRPPFQGENILEIRERVRSAPPEGPARLRAGLSPDLEAVCLKCLEKDPPKRYPSAQALADDLNRWRNNQPVAARPLGLWQRTRQWLRRWWGG